MKKALLILSAVALLAAGANAQPKTNVPVKNVIFLIGDGMGLAQAYAAMDASPEPLVFERAQYVGLAKTFSASSKVTDSAASGTALATGTKTYNGAISVDVDKKPLKTILEKAEDKGLATGIIATYEITNATPAVFIAHNASRKNEEDIAADFLKTDVDVFIGGGRDKFAKRSDGDNLIPKLEAKGYQVVYKMEDAQKITKGKIAGLMADRHMPSMAQGRGDYLPQATALALQVLKNNSPKGFFIMIEGSMIDGGGHANDAEKIISETLDFANAVKVAFDFADKNPGTLVVVTADHETGGLSLPAKSGGKELGYEFGTKSHSGIMVPVYAYGAGSQNFTGIMDNTDLNKRMCAALKLQ